MAVITVHGSILSNFADVGMPFVNAIDKSDELRGDLNKLYKKLNEAGVVANVDTSTKDTKDAADVEKNQTDALSNAYNKLDEFVKDVKKSDNDARDKINELKDDFYSKYYYLKPECEKSGKEKFNDWVNSVISGAQELWECVKNFVKGIVEYIKENWKEVLLKVLAAVAIIVVGAVLTVLTGGAALTLAAVAAAALKGLAVAAVFALVGGTIKAGTTMAGYKAAGYSWSQASLFAGKSFAEGGVDGFLNGSLVFAGSAFGGFATMKGWTAVGKVLTVTKTVSGIGGKIMGGAELVSKISQWVAPESEFTKAFNNITNNGAFKVTKDIVGYVSTFSGAGSDSYGYNVETVTKSRISTEEGSVFYAAPNGEIIPIKTETFELVTPKFDGSNKALLDMLGSQLKDEYIGSKPLKTVKKFAGYGSDIYSSYKDAHIEFPNYTVNYDNLNAMTGFNVSK